MDLVVLIIAVWLVFTAVIFAGIVSVQSVRVTRTNTVHEPLRSIPAAAPCEVLIPVKDVMPAQEEALTSLLTQSHPNYGVLFIVESDGDPANEMLDRLCSRHPRARKIISGPATTGCQKNHNLIAGIETLSPETQVIVFCDSSNVADEDWLVRFTRPLETQPKQVVSTFRDFNPLSQTLGGMCQAIYAAFILVLPRVKPLPWGGATAIHRNIFEELKIAEAWSTTVVDDLILGNALDKHGIPLFLDTANRLGSPLPDQSVAGFLSYLDRQILFPKFTNPSIWLAALIHHLNLTAATFVALLAGLILFPAGLIGPMLGWSSLGLIAGEVLAALMLKRINPYNIPVTSWLLSFLPCVLFAAFIFAQSIFRNDIVWHGKRYIVGKDGVVLSITPA
ncbi:MAG: glycosyltransferase family 2 protein [Thermodesulfobacteriota bacterium]